MKINIKLWSIVLTCALLSGLWTVPAKAADKGASVSVENTAKKAGAASEAAGNGGTLAPAELVLMKEILAPSGIVADGEGGLMIADSYNQAVWHWSADDALTRLAGREGIQNVDGSALGGYVDGKAEKAAFQTPWAVAPYLSGWAITDRDNHLVRYVSAGNVSTLAGAGKAGKADGQGPQAAFDSPTGLVAGPDGCLFVADTGNGTIRKIDTKGNVTTYVGSRAGLMEPTGLYWYEGILYVADSGNSRIVRIEDGVVTSIAGGGRAGNKAGYADGKAGNALFSHPQGLMVSNGIIYVADTGNGAVRAIRNGRVTTLLELGGGGGGLFPVSPRGIVLVKDRLYVGDVFTRAMIVLKPGADFNYFSDLPRDAWYAEAVAKVYAYGILNRTGQKSGKDILAPERKLTGSECKELLEGLKPFLPSDASMPEISIGADSRVTRGEFLTLLWQYTGSQSSAVSLNTYSDYKLVSKKEAAALRWSVEKGILVGKNKKRLASNNPITRAEAAVFLSRYLKL